MEQGIASSSELVRNLEYVKLRYEVLETIGKFRLVQFPPPLLYGYEFWIVNEKGFLWEPAVSLDEAFAYLDSEEARAYNAGPD